MQGKVYGVPTDSAPAFTIYRTDVFAKYGLKAPTTWDDFIAVGKVLKGHGVKITNYAGEDPSTLEVLAMQAGAHWYAIDENSWKVNFQEAGTLKAAKVIQEIVDNDLNSTLSFAGTRPSNATTTTAAPQPAGSPPGRWPAWYRTSPSPSASGRSRLGPLSPTGRPRPPRATNK